MSTDAATIELGTLEIASYDRDSESSYSEGRCSLDEFSIDCAALQSRTYRLTKRVVDVVGALCGLVVLGPFMLAAMVAVWFEDGGPVIFRQKRVGLNGDEFTILKVRTMVKNAESRLAEVAALNHHDDQRTLKVKNDPRMLRCGRLLRKYSVDEFPQLINVLRGDMTIVGPRPPLPREVDLYDAEDHVRLMVKPGLTCYWQIMGRGEIPFKQMVSLDRRYIEDASSLTDLIVITKTFPALLKGSGAH
ncbi:putative sugar transferase EpsL [Roseimaritima multifibrata]|uniref:Putative sugar transferase EpsL n=1 Tax=Roseimaritima multifibrata TaxID=1930274 RepID=A0A517MMK2_9BACT|nr:sugar transferase [Roseimaritima multifibrata]QDS96113.1 putative sugar transferase EpsL [Roseimaritima multifibrata]